MDVNEQIEVFQNFFEKNHLQEILESFQKGKQSVVIDFNSLSQFNIKLAEELLDDPENILKAAEIGIEHFDIPELMKTFSVRIDNIPRDCEIPISKLRAKHLNNFICIKGLIRQKTKVTPAVTSARFECPSCGNTCTVLQLDNKFKEPSICSCKRKGKFRLLSKEMMDMQAMVIEEDPENIDSNQQPQRINIILKNDLTSPMTDEKTIPGGKALVNGILKEAPVFLRDGSISTRSDFIIETNFIKPLEEEQFKLNISEEDKKKFTEFLAKKDFFNELCTYIAPTIHGHDDIKESMLLQMAGGVTKKLQKETPRKGKIHILLVGDPGVGKTVMGRSVLNLVPRARYVSGKGASGAGVTAAVVRNDITKDFGLEAGAMVLANGSVLVVDEMEKMREEDVTQLHTGMEIGKITIDKANIHVTLTAETSILGIANPQFGRFDSYEIIGKQINLPTSLLSRFDLIYIIKDIPDEKKDKDLVRFVLDLHMNKDIPVQLDFDFFRKFISYAKQFEPRITEESISVIEKFFLSMRSQGRVEETKTVGIGTRQLEGLVRMTEASAKLRLSDKTNKEDAERAVRLMLSFLKEFGYDEKTNVFDIDRIQSDTSASERTKIHKIREMIRRLTKEFVDGVVSFEAIVEEAKKEKIEENDVDEIVEWLKRNGELFEPRSGLYREV